MPNITTNHAITYTNGTQYSEVANFVRWTETEKRMAVWKHSDRENKTTVSDGPSFPKILHIAHISQNVIRQFGSFIACEQALLGFPGGTGVGRDSVRPYPGTPWEHARGLPLPTPVPPETLGERARRLWNTWNVGSHEVFSKISCYVCEELIIATGVPLLQS